MHLDLKQISPFFESDSFDLFSKLKNGDVDVLMLPPKRQTFHRKLAINSFKCAFSWKSHCCAWEMSTCSHENGA